MEAIHVLNIIAFAATLGLTVLAERILIPVLKSVKMEQKILDIGPRWHKSKEGTPTMGGLGFAIPLLVVCTAVMIYIRASGKSSSVVSLVLTFILGVLDYTVYPDKISHANYDNSSETFNYVKTTAKDTCWYEWCAVAKYAVSYAKSKSPNAIFTL